MSRGMIVYMINIYLSIGPMLCQQETGHVLDSRRIYRY